MSVGVPRKAGLPRRNAAAAQSGRSLCHRRRCRWLSRSKFNPPPMRASALQCIVTLVGGKSQKSIETPPWQQTLQAKNLWGWISRLHALNTLGGHSHNFYSMFYNRIFWVAVKCKNRNLLPKTHIIHRLGSYQISLEGKGKYDCLRDLLDLKESHPLPEGMNFRKCLKQPLTPLPLTFCSGKNIADFESSLASFYGQI